MKLDPQTLIFMLSLALVTQVIALLVQFKIGSKTFRGVGWWLMGISLMAVGVLFMAFVRVESLLFLAMTANPLMVLGMIFLFIAIMRFFDKKENRWIIGSLYTVFILFYYYYIFFNNDISSRTIVINGTVAIVSYLAAFKLFTMKDRFVTSAAGFTATIFLIYGGFSTFRVFWTIFTPPIQTYQDQAFFVNAGFIVPTVVSTLLTFGFILMANQRLNTETLQDKEKMHLIFNTSPDAVELARLSDGLLVDVNEGFTELFGYTREEVLGISTIKINFWRHTEDRQDFLRELNDQGRCGNMEFVFQRKDGSEFFGMVSARIMEIQEIPHIVSVIRDITERKQAEVAIMESEELYRSILKASPDNITITDLEGRILIISPAAKEMFGYEPSVDDFTDMNLLDFIIPEDVERAKTNLRQMHNGGFHKPNEYCGLRRDKTVFNIEVNSGLARNPNGEPIRMVFIIRDITERKMAEQQIKELVQQLEIEKNTAQLNSITDSMTGLANRRYFDISLKTAFYRLKRSGETLSLIMIDVDQFKDFNDTYGHVAGDDCLIRIGKMLKEVALRAPDTAARYGGEEFAVILPETESFGAKAIAERIRKGVEDLGIPHAASDVAECVTVSLGVVSVSTKGMLSPEQVVALADEALYLAKNSGRNRVKVAN